MIITLKKEREDRQHKSYLISSVIFLILFLSFASFSSANTFGYNYLDNKNYILEGVNYSINVNNTEYFHGYTPSTLYTYYRGLLQTYFNGVYCQLAGCTMEGNINMDNYNITNIKSSKYTNSSYGIYSNSTDIVFGYIEGL
jgi:hypothetical protein